MRFYQNQHSVIMTQHHGYCAAILLMICPLAAPFSPACVCPPSLCYSECAALLALQAHSWYLLTFDTAAGLKSLLWGTVLAADTSPALQTSDHRRLDSFSLPRDPSRQSRSRVASAAKPCPSLGLKNRKEHGKKNSQRSRHRTSPGPWNESRSLMLYWTWSIAVKERE